MMHGTSGNKSEGIDHIYLNGQSSKEEQERFKKIQRKRLRGNNIAIAIKLLFVLVFIGGILFSQMNSEGFGIGKGNSEKLIMQTVDHINSGEYKKALESADAAFETGNNASHSHFYKGVTFFHLGQFYAAKDEMTKMASNYGKTNSIPNNYLPMYLFTQDGNFSVSEKMQNRWKIIRYGINSIRPYFFEDRKLCYSPTVYFSLDYDDKRQGQPTCFSEELIERATLAFSKGRPS